MMTMSRTVSGQVSQQVERGFSWLQQRRSVAKINFCSSCRGPAQFRSSQASRCDVLGGPKSFLRSRTVPEVLNAENRPSALLRGLDSKCRPLWGLQTTLKSASTLRLKKQAVRQSSSYVKASAKAQTLTEEGVEVGESSAKLDDKWEIKMLYDGECPLCMREVNMLRKRDASTRKIKFVDIATDSYDPSANAGIDFEMAMGRIHGIQRDGTIVTNVEAFRKFYEAVNLGWVYAITKNKAVLKVADAVYDMWAKYRMQVTGRPPIEQILEERKKRQERSDSLGDRETARKDRCRVDT